MAVRQRKFAVGRRHVRRSVRACPLRIADRCTVVTSDVIAWLPAARNIDIALIDPPYTFDAWPQLLERLHAHYAVCESGREVPPPPGWSTWRAKRYGRTWSTVLERDGDES